MKREQRLGLLLLGLVFIVLAFDVMAWAQPLDGHPWRPRPDIYPEDLPELRAMMLRYFWGKSIIGAINAVLLLYLLIVYYRVYRETKSQFSLGLVMMSTAFLLFVVTSIPLFNWALGGRNLFGAFNFIEDIFTTIVAVIMIYLSRQ